jgi:methanogenic corrinoid protein MtbC1
VTDAADKRLDELIVRMNERAALAAVSERLDAGEQPETLLDECRAGVERVGRLYEQGTYYISALIMAGEIFREAAELLIPRLEADRARAPGGKMVIATVRGDIHDIGKNIVIALLDADGYTMVDLGVNVTPEQIAGAVERERPDVLGLSCLLTAGAATPPAGSASSVRCSARRSPLG